jgi:hypothetical protein
VDDVVTVTVFNAGHDLLEEATGAILRQLKTNSMLHTGIFNLFLHFRTCYKTPHHPDNFSHNRQV